MCNMILQMLKGGHILYKLLVVDDEVATAKALCNYFPWGSLGFEVVCLLENGCQALEYILHNPVDVVLCDIIMPVMTGIDLAREIFERNIKNVKVIFLSGHKEFEYAQKALSFGVRYYVLKPTNYEDLMDIFGKVKNDLDTATYSSSMPSSENIEEKNENSYNYNQKIIETIKKHVQTNYSTATLEEAAMLAHMSPNYLSSFFKQKSGDSFSNYVIKIKMQKAAQLLKGIDYKTYEISSMVGYSNTQNFTRTFKNFYGMTPREYRNQPLDIVRPL